MIVRVYASVSFACRIVDRHEAAAQLLGFAVLAGPVWVYDAAKTSFSALGTLFIFS